MPRNTAGRARASWAASAQGAAAPPRPAEGDQPSTQKVWRGIGKPPAPPALAGRVRIAGLNELQLKEGSDAANHPQERQPTYPLRPKRAFNRSFRFQLGPTFILPGSMDAIPSKGDQDRWIGQIVITALSPSRPTSRRTPSRRSSA